MGLNYLIKNLSDRDKSKILGDNTTKIIRYSFVNNDKIFIEKLYIMIY